MSDYSTRLRFRWVQAQCCRADMPGKHKNALDPVNIPLKKRCPRCQAINLSSSKRDKDWEGWPPEVRGVGQSWPCDASTGLTRQLQKAVLTNCYPPLQNLSQTKYIPKMAGQKRSQHKVNFLQNTAGLNSEFSFS